MQMKTWKDFLSKNYASPVVIISYENSLYIGSQHPRQTTVKWNGRAVEAWYMPVSNDFIVAVAHK